MNSHEPAYDCEFVFRKRDEIIEMAKHRIRMVSCDIENETRALRRNSDALKEARGATSVDKEHDKEYGKTDRH